ncbi:MAG: hypothetical protein WD358_00105 [Nitriliruptoraceae bacterium]
MADAAENYEIEGREVRVSSPDKVWFPEVGLSKRDIVDYYRRVADLLMPHCLDRPCNLKRYPDGVDGKWFMQKRLPANRPEWLRTAEVTFSSGRTAVELCPSTLADVLWAVNLGAMTVHPWSVKFGEGAWADLPDELRVDLDPMPGVDFATVRRVAAVVAEVLDEHGLVGFPKTSGSTGIHVIVPIERRSYIDVRAAAVALAREVERRCDDATSAWWKEERGQRVFLDYNQNLWDRTTACAYAVRATSDARVSWPFTWSELDDVEPCEATVTSVPAMIAGRTDPFAARDQAVRPIDGLLELAARDVAAELEDLPLPPHYPKLPNEPPRVPPSRAKR